MVFVEPRTRSKICNYVTFVKYNFIELRLEPTEHHGCEIFENTEMNLLLKARLTKLLMESAPRNLC